MSETLKEEAPALLAEKLEAMRSEGMHSGNVDEFLERALNAPADDAENEESPPADKEEQSKSEQSAEEPQKDETKEAVVEEEAPDFDKFGFKEDGEEEKKEDAFDERAFDSETEREIRDRKMDENAGEAFKRLRSELKEFKKGQRQTDREKDLANRMSELEAEAKRVKDLEAQVEELANINYEVKVKSSTEYKNAVEKPVQEVLGLVRQLSQEYGLSEESLADAIKEPSLRKQAEMIDGLRYGEDEDELPGVHKSALYAAATTYRGVQAKHDDMLANAKEKFEQSEQERLAAQKEHGDKRARLVRDQIAELRDAYSRSLPHLFGDNGEYAGDVEKASRTAMAQAALFSSGEMSLENAAYAIEAGARQPALLKHIHKLETALKKYQGQESEDRKSAANLGEGVVEEDKEMEAEAPGTFVELLRKQHDQLRNMPLQ